MTKYRFIIQRYSTFIEDYIDEDSGNVVSIRRPDKLLGTYYTSMFLPSGLSKSTIKAIFADRNTKRKIAILYVKTISHKTYREISQSKKYKFYKQPL